MRRLLYVLMGAGMLLVIWLAATAPLKVRAEELAMTPSQLISALNAYRAANGLNTLTVNNTLMTLAQGQADYQASIGSVTHTGPGGTSPRDRAYAAGYGDGQAIFLSEIIYGGTGATAATAMSWWKQSPNHNPWMLSPNYTEVGAGVASAGDRNYFTMELGAVAGGSAPSSSSSSDDDQGSAAVVVIPVVAATPNPDGSIVHIVRTGQALWNIAAVYKVTMEELMELNGITQYDYIHPGDEIIVQAPFTPTPTATKTPSPTNTRPPATKTPTTTATPEGGIPTATATVAAGAGIVEGDDGETVQEALENPTLRGVVVIALGVLVVVLLASMLLQRPEQPPKSTDDEDVLKQMPS